MSDWEEGWGTGNKMAAMVSAVTGFRNGASGDRLISSPSSVVDQRINRRISPGGGEQAGIQFGALKLRTGRLIGRRVGLGASNFKPSVGRICRARDHEIRVLRRRGGEEKPVAQ